VTRQLRDHAVDRVREQFGIAIRDAAVDDAVLQVTDRVVDRDLTVSREDGRERLVGRGELDDREVLAVFLEPAERRADAELDASYRILFVADGGLLALTQLVVRRLQ
jgi:hypothetical protein